MEGDFTWGGEHTVQCTDNVLQNCTLETYIILLTSVTPVNTIKFFKEKSLEFKEWNNKAIKEFWGLIQQSYLELMGEAGIKARELSGANVTVAPHTHTHHTHTHRFYKSG